MKAKKKEDEIESYYTHLSLVVIICSALTSIFIYVAAVNYTQNIVTIFNFFEKSYLVEEYVIRKSTSFTSKDVITFLVGLFIYFYFFEFIKQNRIYSSIGNEKESKYFQFLRSLFGLYNFCILIPFALYLVFIKKAYFETLTILFFCFIGNFVFRKLLITYSK